jgi:hypothetical protein
MYNLLFAAVATTLQKVAADPKQLGARIGFLAVLHSWNQQLLYHPHIHCVVPGGGLSSDKDRWIPARAKFFLPVRVLSKVFRGVFMQTLQQAYQEGLLTWHGEVEHLQDPAAFHRFIQPAWEKDWVVYAKPPFAGPEGVIQYLGQYTHRIAISNHRLVCQDETNVTFSWKNRRQNRKAHLTLTGHEFMRRFLLHVLPPHFVRLRQYGFLANAKRRVLLALLRDLLHVTPPPDPSNCPNHLLAPIHWKTCFEAATGINIDQCPMCRVGIMQTVRILLPRPVPRQPIRAPRGAPICDSS